MYFANEELKELNKERVELGIRNRLAICDIHQLCDYWDDEKANHPTAYSCAMWAYAYEMNMWPFEGRLHRAIPIIQNDPLCMDAESAKKYEEAMATVTNRVGKVLPGSVRLNSGNGKVSFTHIFSEMLKVTNSVKSNPDAKPKKLIPGYYGDNYISPNLVDSLELYLQHNRLTPGFLSVELLIGLYQIPYQTVEKSDHKLGAKLFRTVGRRPYSRLAFGNMFSIVFQIRHKELNPMLRDFANFVSSASTYTFNNLNHVRVSATDYELENQIIAPVFVKALQASPTKAFSNAELKYPLFNGCGRWMGRVNMMRKFPDTIKRENMGCLDKTLLYLNTQRYFADEIYANLNIVEDASKYEHIEDAFVDHFKSPSIESNRLKDPACVETMYDLSSPEYLAPPEINKELTQQRKEWIAQQKAARKQRRQLLEQDKAKEKARQQQKEEDQAKRVCCERYSIELFSKKTGKSIEVLSLHNTMDEAVSTAKQYSKQSSFVKDLETKDLVIVNKKYNFRGEVLESKATKLTIRRKKK